MNVRRLVAAAAAAVVAATAGAALPALAAPNDHANEHAKAVAYWTAERVRSAKNLDYVYDEAKGEFRKVTTPLPMKGKPGTGGGTTGVLGADWTGGGLVQEATGKILFTMGGANYVCSATSTKDSATDRTVVTTAGHCVYDNETQAFATNWIFIPNYDATPVTLSSTGSFCPQTKYGCWTAQTLVASRAFTGETAFSTTATLHDYAFAVMGAGGHQGTQLDATVGAQAIEFTKEPLGTTASLFGYPAASPYTGKVLTYSQGALGTDPLNGNQTYRVASTMTGGCSGGPWLAGLAGGAGTQFSVNSYGYSRSTYMQGPFFNSETQQMYNIASSTTARGGITN